MRKLPRIKRSGTKITVKVPCGTGGSCRGKRDPMKGTRNPAHHHAKVPKRIKNR